MRVDRGMFREYDIRGVFGEDLTPEAAYGIARAFAKYAAEEGRERMVVGADNRKSSPVLREAVIEGLVDSGFKVLDLGTVITPVFYHACVTTGVGAGIMVTASHNPPQYNGFKLFLGQSTLYGEQIQRIADMVESDDFVEGRGSVERYDHKESYFADLLQRIGCKLPLRIAIDCGNGTASLFAVELFERAGAQVYPLYCQSDPNFPNHQPDPVKAENMKDLQKLVVEGGLDVGLGFDGDGDRLGVVDDSGTLLFGDTLMALFWREILKNRDPKTVKAIVEVKCSEALVEEIRRLGAEPVLWKTGHSLIKAKMKELNSPFAGEMSGHLFFADQYYGFDDALYAGLRLLRLIVHSGKKLSELVAEIPSYYSSPEIRIHYDDTKKFELVQKAKQYFMEREYPVVDVDGVRVYIGSGWGLIRASNTGPEIIVRYEAKERKDLDVVKDELEGALRSGGLEVVLPDIHK
ncbi:phosphomannomutase/phosphoglucomutase [Coprothermobacteraceae bacterium]|nr:phosphomannomutase/phosphoglucomutase [Coprothermobacteraceae bacterium]